MITERHYKPLVLSWLQRLVLSVLAVGVLLPANSYSQDEIAKGVRSDAPQLKWRKEYSRLPWIGGGTKVTKSMLDIESQIGRSTKEGAKLHDEHNKTNRTPSKLPSGVSRNHKLAESDLASLLIHVHARIWTERNSNKDEAQKEESINNMISSVDSLLKRLTGKDSKRLEPDLSSPSLTRIERIYETDFGNELYDKAISRFRNSLGGTTDAHREDLFYAVRFAAQGPPNLRFGDSRTNSRIQDNFDPNETDGRKTPISDGIHSAVAELADSGAAHPDMVNACILPLVKEGQVMFSSSMTNVRGTFVHFPQDFLKDLGPLIEAKRKQMSDELESPSKPSAKRQRRIPDPN